ncbi:hypothetical protein VTK56DRAFT_4112 [Thermocarpiscus australiensis]
METNLKLISVPKTRAFSNLPVQPSRTRPADADTRAAKRRRRDHGRASPRGYFRSALPGLHVRSVQPRADPWCTSSAFIPDTHDTSNGDSIFAWPAAGQGQASLQQIPHQPGTMTQVKGHAFGLIGSEPTGSLPAAHTSTEQRWADAYGPVTPAHMQRQWHPLPHLPVDFTTPDAWPRFRPAALIEPEGIHDQFLAGASYASSGPLPAAPPPFVDHNSHSVDGVPLGLESRCCYPPGGQLIHKAGPSREQSSYLSSFLPEVEESTPWLTAISVSNGHAGVVGAASSPIKQEHPDQSDCREWGAAVYSNGPHVAVAQEFASFGDWVRDEGPRDRKKRGRFDEDLRKQTSDTRSMGACVRCHNQRVRCVPNKLDSSSPLAPCETCLKVRRNSKKTIHNIPCLRFRVTSIVIYRAGGLDLTKRFTHTQVMDIAEYPDNIIYDIEVTQGLSQDPVRLRVRRFCPTPTDIEYRRYVENGIAKQQAVGPFCLASVEQTAEDFRRYIDRNALAGLAESVKNSDELVKDTFAMIAKHCISLCDPIKLEDAANLNEAKKNTDQKDFLLRIVRLWFAILHGTGSAWLCGSERLGMRPESEPNLPLPGRIPIPRMIVAQFDSIRHERIYRKTALEVLRTLETFLTSCNKEAWFTVFLATFLLLHLVACTCQDRYRYAKQNVEVMPLETRYGPINHPLTRFVEEVQHGAATLPLHWQYFKRCDLMNFNWDEVGESTLMFLEPHQIEFLKRTVARMKTKLDSIPKTPAEGCWEHELFWISHMFLSEQSRTSDWNPPETFTRDKPSVGREAS